LAEKSRVIVFNSDGMGHSEAQDLPKVLAHKFLALIGANGLLPDAICFYADGVKLACTGSPVVAELRALEARGVELVLCQTCLETLGLSERVGVGVVGGMTDIITAIWEADSVVTL